MRPIEAAARVVAELQAGGVRDVVLCPGSRSAPLAYALELAEREGLLRLHVRHDERTAGFLALGLGKADNAHPAAVVTTSGTAVANLLPAVLEARHAGVPMLLVTADRPPRLRGTWANQTSDFQPRLFGDVAVAAVDVEAATLPSADLAELVGQSLVSARRGPVHLNLCFDNPLQPEVGESVTLPRPLTQLVADLPIVQPEPDLLKLGLRTVVIAGDGAGPQARSLAEKARWPLLAEPTSGSRGGECLVDCYRLVADRADFAERVERVVVFGRPTLSRPISALTERGDVELVQVVNDPADPGPGRQARRVLAVEVPGADEPPWLGEWIEAGRRARAHVDAVLSDSPTLRGPGAAELVSSATGGADALLLGASNPIRDVDLMARALPADALVLANRGLAGIDGTVSTAVGVAVASGRATRALIGDLTLLHDLGGLAIPAREREGLRLQLVVLNDDGGGIFATLEHGRHAEPFERVFGTPTGADIASLAQGFGISYRCPDTAQDLAAALREVSPGVELIEVRSERHGLEQLTQRLTSW